MDISNSQNDKTNFEHTKNVEHSENEAGSMESSEIDQDVAQCDSVQQESLAEQESSIGSAATNDNDDSAKLQQLENVILRLHADIDNIRKRHEKEIVAAHKYGQEKLMRELLPVLDSFEMAMQSLEESDANKALLDGIKLTGKMLVDALHKHSLVSIEPHKEQFDPEKHEAMTIVTSPDVKANTVVDVIQKGYALSDRLLRPARVIVSGNPDKSGSSA